MLELLLCSILTPWSGKGEAGVGILAKPAQANPSLPCRPPADKALPGGDVSGELHG